MLPYAMINIRYHSGIYTLEAEQALSIRPEDAWAFLSSPDNLSRITPPHMGFLITSGTPAKMYTGQIITYSVGILPGVRASWVTEITHVEEGRYFIDEQRFGPYAMWHHEHWIEPTATGVIMRDRVSYKLPMGPFGRLAHPFIKRQLQEIFGYREKAMRAIFPEPT